MHRSCVPDCTRSKKSLHPGFLGPTTPSYADQILRFSNVWVLMFDLSMGHIAPPTHCLPPVADHSTRPISPRHRVPPCCHPSTTHPAGGGALSQGPDVGEKISWAPCIRTPCSSVRNLAILLEVKGSVTEAMPVSVESTCVAWGGSAWRGCQMWEVDGSWRR